MSCFLIERLAAAERDSATAAQRNIQVRGPSHINQSTYWQHFFVHQHFLNWQIYN
jgi:hypothetical protein